MSFYPKTPPLKQLADSISIIGKGEYAARGKELTHNVWYIAGYALFMSVGDPDDNLIGDGGLDEEVTRKFIRLEDELTLFLGLPQTYGDPGARKIDWSRLYDLLMKILPLIAPFLKD